MDVCMLASHESQDLPFPEGHIVPITFNDAIKDPQWIAVMQSEMDSIWKNNKYSLSNLPPGFQAISCKWVFNIKKGCDEEPDIQKARLVAKGFQQVKGVDYQETFAPVIKWATI
jgi:hypothetical protein